MNSDRFSYIAREVKVSFFVNFKISFNGFFARKNFFKKFCADSGIDLPLRYDRKHILPEEYLIRNRIIEYIFEIRDKMIVSAYETYYRNDEILNVEIANTNARIENMKKYLANEEEKLKKIKMLLGKEKDPQQYIFYESKEYEATSRIGNQTVELNSINAWSVALMKKKHENQASWLHQIDLINGYIRQYVLKYMFNIGRKVVRKLDFDDFTCDNFDYAGQAKAIMESNHAKNKN